MLTDWLGILLLALVVAAGAAGLLVLSALLGPRQPDEAKLAPYECGLWPERHAARQPIRLHFYVVAMMFMLFALETAFLLPWAVVLDERLGPFGLVEMGIFLAILIIGYVYVWQRGAFEWHMAEEDGEAAR